MEKSAISKPTLQRLPIYLNYLQSLPKSVKMTSATQVALALGLNEVQVRKDLSIASRNGGKPKTGYEVEQLRADLEEFLGYNHPKEAILIGVGKMGSALLSFTGFQQLGMKISYAFDNDPEKIGTEINHIPIYHIREMKKICQERQIHIGILTTRPEPAQELCTLMLESGILAIWNFSTALLNVPENIIVHNENLAVSLAMISHQLDEQQKKEETSC